MEKKEFSTKTLAAIKRIAMNVDAAINKKNKLEEKKAAIEDELAELYEDIALMEAPVKRMTGGYGVEDIIVKTVTPNGKLDAKGNMQKTTKYEFKYPETIIPPFQPEALQEGETVDETPVGETETPATEAPYNPIEGMLD